ncbi:MAG: hypothetical protein LBS19_09215 [Clostridiales bacterium]|jgi:hypothetical protein|nr:hypothetical protein [Clostridiales bacterium]
MANKEKAPDVTRVYGEIKFITEEELDQEERDMWERLEKEPRAKPHVPRSVKSLKGKSHTA